eukprot:CAMPEP_0119132040 /NCGR_PEP_ID=MMETSP1310-20130426/11247_1 /TAXON_ID=464262 /ORGANISM="Genus nov. species nov., Strain RCC2339" /LENGTH=253 /DNA_ID=CAMNT_0007122651 /DNA_START=54 /DNA_END=815 /DNA_ORIENTATION=+
MDGVVDFFRGFDYPSPVGLCLGLLSVLVMQIVVVVYHYVHSFHMHAVPVQKALPERHFWQDLKGHFMRPEGFALLGTYLTVTWMFRLLPATYYSFEGGVNVWQVALQLMSIDFLQAVMHMGEHKISSAFYRVSHKPHHRFINPKLFDAFDGSTADTIFMILVPLFITAHLVHCNVWSYMAFGSTYAAWLTLIHSEFAHPWDSIFLKLGLGTAADHHVHHKLFIFNFGHLFMWWDWIAGTYRSPTDVKAFSKDI